MMRLILVWGVWLTCGLLSAETLTLPRAQCPAWLRQEGIVMAGSWEPLLFRVRRDGAAGYTPTAEQRADYVREHSPEMMAQLKALGVNFIMMHCYKGGGLQAEGESMADGVRFARLARESGMRVGVYNCSGAFIWELFFKEMPQAKDWVVLNPDGSPVTYGKANYRYYWNRNHPDAQAFYRGLVRFAVQEMGVDLVHFDNYHVGPGWDRNSIERFREYLGKTFSDAQRREHGLADLGKVQPPGKDAPPLLVRAWQDFQCKSLADAYADMNRYARSLRPDILVECNPAGVRPTISPPVDHGRLLQGGEALWDESGASGFRKGRLQSRIRTYKVARLMENTVFSYTPTPIEAAESMAFNLDCLGAICWFEYGRIVARPGVTEKMSDQLGAYVRFFHQQRDLLRNARVLADVAVVRSFPSMLFGERKQTVLTGAVEENLILKRVPFQILYDHQYGLLPRYRAAVLAGCAALSDRQVEQIRAYVSGGGRVCVVGPLATHDEWMLPRAKPALDDLPSDRVVRVSEKEDAVAAIQRAIGGAFSLEVRTAEADGTPGLCAELTEQPGRRLVHLVNYRQEPVADVSVSLDVPSGVRVRSVTEYAPTLTSPVPVPFQQKNNRVTWKASQINVYRIAVATYQ